MFGAVKRPPRGWGGCKHQSHTKQIARMSRDGTDALIHATSPGRIHREKHGVKTHTSKRRPAFAQQLGCWRPSCASLAHTPLTRFPCKFSSPRWNTIHGTCSFG